MRRVAIGMFACAAALALAAQAEARPRKTVPSAGPGAVTQFCGDRVCPTSAPEIAGRARAAGGPHAENGPQTARHGGRSRNASRRASYGEMTILPHPAGCPRRAFCACGASVEVFGRPIRRLFPVASWKKAFPRTVPAPGMVAIENVRSHLFVLRRHVEGYLWEVADYNSGGHISRLHVRSIEGATVVNPKASTVSAVPWLEKGSLE